MMEREGLDRTVCDLLDLLSPRRRRRTWATGADSSQHIERCSKAPCASPSSASTYSCTTPTCRCPRPSATRRIHHGVNLEIDWIDAEDPDLDEKLAEATASSCRGVRQSRDRGQDPRRAVRPRERRAVPGHLPGHAGRDHRVRPPRGRHGRRQLAPSSTRRPRTRSSTCCPSNRASRIAAARCASAPIRSPLVEGTGGRECYEDAPVIYERHRHRYEVNPMLRHPARGQGPGRLRPIAQRPSGRDDRAAGPALVLCVAVPPGVQEPPDVPAPLFRDFVGAAVGARLHAAS